jgi:hypothetical protein
MGEFDVEEIPEEVTDIVDEEIHEIVEAEVPEVSEDEVIETIEEEVSNEPEAEVSEIVEAEASEAVEEEPADVTEDIPVSDKKLDFPVFRTSLFPDYNSGKSYMEEPVSSNIDKIIEESHSSENLKKEQELINQTDELLARLGIELGTKYSSNTDFFNIHEDTASAVEEEDNDEEEVPKADDLFAVKTVNKETEKEEEKEKNHNKEKKKFSLKKK